MIEDRPKKKIRKQASNRLSLSEKAQAKANAWLIQIEKEFSGMLSLKRNDLLNTILEELDDTLSASLLDKIRGEKLTGKEKAKWIYQKFLEAEKKGLEADLDDLIETARGSTKKKRKPRKKPNTKSQTPLSESAEISPKNIKNSPNIN